MEAIVASAQDIKFDIETALDMQLGAKPLPFPGMDKSGAAICTFYLRGTCDFGQICPYRHVRADRSVVCKHWLRGLCKKGDDCEFLHEYDMAKMPECYFFQKFGECGNKECPFLHIDPETKRRDCPWYDRGFCRHGPNCKNRHVRRVICTNYLCGFCILGPSCKFSHPKFGLPNTGEIPQFKRPTCHHCGEIGHVIYKCFKLPEEDRAKLQEEHNKKMLLINAMRDKGVTNVGFSEDGFDLDKSNAGDSTKVYKPIEEITCYKCGEMGHFANKCPKGHLAFLSSAKQNLEASKQ